jgi:hypothetical protein
MQGTKVDNGAHLLAGSYKRALEKQAAAKVGLAKLQDELAEFGGAPVTAPLSVVAAVQVC